MEENCSIKLFESDLESMLSQVLAKACSRDEKLKAAKEKAVELKHQNEKLNAVLDLEKPSALTCLQKTMLYWKNTAFVICGG